MRDKVSKGRQAKGSDFVDTKLTMKQVVAIRTSKISQRKTAKKLGVSKSLIGAIRRNECWAWVVLA